jgi:hypothetical protein
VLIQPPAKRRTAEQPLEQALRTCLIAIGIGERTGLGPETLSEVCYTALLRFLGCSSDAH